jgi:hypothetical protein
VNVMTRAQIQAHSVPGNKTIVIWSESSTEIEARSVPGNRMVVLGHRMSMERSLRLKAFKGSDILWASKVQKLFRLRDCFGFILNPGFKKRQWQCLNFKSNSGFLETIFYKTTTMISIGEHGRVSFGRKQTSNESNKLAFIATWTLVL